MDDHLEATVERQHHRVSADHLHSSSSLTGLRTVVRGTRPVQSWRLVQPPAHSPVSHNLRAFAHREANAWAQFAVQESHKGVVCAPVGIVANFANQLTVEICLEQDVAVSMQLSRV